MNTGDKSLKKAYLVIKIEFEITKKSDEIVVWFDIIID
jgi:hypothetical protein